MKNDYGGTKHATSENKTLKFEQWDGKNYNRSVRIAEALAKTWLNWIPHKYKSDILLTCLVREKSKCSKDKPWIKYISVSKHSRQHNNIKQDLAQ